MVLSSWFRWITDGSEEDPLASNVVGQMVKVMNLVEQFLLSKNGEEYERELAGVKETTELHYGNDIFCKVFLIR